MDIKNDDSEIYWITAGDIRGVAEQEGFDNLTDAEIDQIADKMGDYIPWSDAVAMALGDCLPASRRREQ